jgi:hypothetical protein
MVLWLPMRGMWDGRLVALGAVALAGACGDNGTGSGSATNGSTSTTTLTSGATDVGSTGSPTTGATGTVTSDSAGTLGETMGTTGGPTTSTSDPSTGGGTTMGATSGPLPDMGPACADTCEDGVCVGDVCCPINQACTDTCCGDGEVCSFQECVVPGNECVDATDCGDGFYCEYALGEMEQPPMCMGGVSLDTGKCLPQPPECPDGVEPVEGEPITCLPQCEVMPPVDDFAIVLKQYWGQQNTPPYATDVMMAPVVVNLDDDNCDGKINEKDIPEIVFSTFTGGAYYKQGTLHAISVVGGQLVDKWTKPNVVQPSGGLAAGDLDGDGVPEIVGCMNPGPNGVSCCDAVAYNTGAIAFKADGSTLWTQPDTAKVHCGPNYPAIGDVDQDGSPEVLVGFTLLDGKTGAVKKELDPATSWGQRLTGLSDLDGDGMLDITDGQRAYKADGTVLWDLRNGPNAIPFGYHGVGDFDLDGVPEVVVISSGGPHTMSLVHYDKAEPGGARVIRKGVDINNGISTKTFCNAASEYGGGAPTVADFNGDGTPDVGAAGAVGYIVFSGKLMMDPSVQNADLDLWFKTTKDCSSAVTGSSVFDFNGDGKAEVIYADEHNLWMYDGVTGTNLIQSTCNTNGTLWEYPLVADVDNDGQADIVVGSNAYGVSCNNTKQSGIRIFGSAKGSWVRTRRIWNQHTYHVTNINEDGSVPQQETANWTVDGLNNYRQNIQPEGEFAAPDLTATLYPLCEGPYGIVARVRNIGQAAVPAGVVVGFYEGDPDMGGVKLGEGMTKKALYPAEAEDVTLDIPNPSPGLLDGSIPVFVVLDDGMPMHAWKECRLNNNKIEGSGFCAMPG